MCFKTLGNSSGHGKREKSGWGREEGVNTKGRRGVGFMNQDRRTKSQRVTSNIINWDLRGSRRVLLNRGGQGAKR